MKARGWTVGRPVDPDERRIPAYDLSKVREAFSSGRYEVTSRVRRHVRRKRWYLRDLEQCIEDLEYSDFHKSQRHIDKPDVWLDIYRPLVAGNRRYVKFMAQDSGEYLVLTFCNDGEAH